MKVVAQLYIFAFFEELMIRYCIVVANTPAYFFCCRCWGEEGIGISWCGSGWDGRTAAAGEVTSWGLQSLAVETPSKVNSDSLEPPRPSLLSAGGSNFRVLLRCFKGNSTCASQVRAASWQENQRIGGGEAVLQWIDFFLRYFPSPLKGINGLARLACPIATDHTCPSELTTVKSCCPFSCHNDEDNDET